MEVLTLRMTNGKEFRFYSDLSLWIIHINRIDVVDKGCEGQTIHIPFSSIEYFTTESYGPDKDFPMEDTKKIVEESVRKEG